jgi:hypothetical protein
MRGPVPDGEADIGTTPPPAIRQESLGSQHPSGLKTMKQNAMFLFVGAACVALGAVGYWFYQQQNRSGVEVNIGGRSLTIETR